MTQPRLETHDMTSASQDATASSAEITHEVQMPQLLQGETSGRITRWHVSEGQEIAPGDIIADISTARTTMEVEAEDPGRIIQILVREGADNVKSGTPIAVVAAQLATAPAPAPAPELATRPAKAPAAPTVSTLSAPEPSSPHPAAEPSAKLEDETETLQKSITVRVALREALSEEMERDDRVFILGEDVGDEESTFKVTYGLKSRFGAKRIIDMPVTPAGFSGLALGAGLAGLRPVVEFQHWSFALQAIDQIVNTAAKMRYVSAGRLNIPVVFRGPNGAASRVGAQQGQNFAPWLTSIPGLVVAAPATASDAKGLLKQAIRSNDPVIILETERLYGRVGPVPDVTDHLCPFGSASIVKSGSTVTLVSYSGGVALCLEAANRLGGEGIDAEVIDLRSLRPLDEETIYASVRKTKRLVTVEEAWPCCSIGSEIAARVMTACFDDLDAPPTRVTGADIPLPYAANLERLALPSANDIVSAAKKVCYL
ncbi:MAG: pyruvate dehydrogenase complex E1 component subunit beta [Pseudomonadota bacterium]